MPQYILTRQGRLHVAIAVTAILLAFALILHLSVIPSYNDAGKSDESSDGVPSDVEQSLDSSEDDDNRRAEQLEAQYSLLTPAFYDANKDVLTFYFAPQWQTFIDDNTLSLIGELLKSPKNTADAKIAMDIPSLSDEYALILANAIVDAFSSYDIPLSEIMFYVYYPESNQEEYGIRVEFR